MEEVTREQRQRIALELLQGIKSAIVQGERLTYSNGRLNWPGIATWWDLLSTGERIIVGVAAVIGDGPPAMRDKATIDALAGGLDSGGRAMCEDALQKAGLMGALA